MKTYLRHRISNVIDVKELIALELLDFEGKYRNYVETHDFWEICYVTKGEITLFLDEKEVTVREHELVLVSPNRKHSYYSEKGNENQAFVVCFDSFSQALNAISDHVFAEDSLQYGCMEKIMEESATTFHMNDKEHLEVLDAPRFGGQQVLLLQLEYLLIGLVRRMSVEKNSDIVFFSDENFYVDLVNAIARFLRENVSQKITLDEICTKFNYSKSFICKIFKKEKGVTVIAYFNSLKVEEAKRLLTESTHSVSHIADLCGYREVKYFDTIFKKHTGTSPVTFRKLTTNHRNQEARYELSKN
ncbi:MAG: AraC family transcriptional regulator [Lachnospiraceae bacterium]|nr:AraC family transcriptional regulator [Lachnospiraceae bacterium]